MTRTGPVGDDTNEDWDLGN